MKLYYEQLESYTQPLSSLYFIYGTPEILTIDAKRQIGKKAKKQGFISEKYFSTINFDPLALLDSLHNLSLFQEKRLIEIFYLTEKLDKDIETFITSFITQAPTDTICIIKAGKLSNFYTKKKLFNLINKHGVVIPIYPLKSFKMASWLKSKARQFRITLNHDEINLILNYAQDDVSVAYQILAKLYLAFGSTTISVNDIKQILHEEHSYTLPELTKSILSGDLNLSFEVLNTFKGQYGELPLIVWLLTKEIRNVMQLQLSTKNNTAPNGQLSTNVQQMKLYQQAANRLKLDHLNMSLAYLSQIDRIIKGLEKGDPWLELEKLILILNGKLSSISLLGQYSLQ